MQTNLRDAYASHIFQGDCENCFGLCCVALAFTASADFPVDKAGGVPCKNLEENFRCGIHQNLCPSGYSGCTVFDCMGAGQKVSQHTFGGKSWKDRPESAIQMFQVLPIMQQLQEMIFYLTQAMERLGEGELEENLHKSRQTIERLTLAPAESLLSIDLPHHRHNINKLLVEISDIVRLDSGRCNKKKNRKKGPNFQGMDLMGAKFPGKDMRGSSFRGAYLIGADLGNTDLRNSDFIGADLRNANLSGANLKGSLYLTQMQLNSARGDASTKIPDLLSVPAHWS